MTGGTSPIAGAKRRRTGAKRSIHVEYDDRLPAQRVVNMESRRTIRAKLR